MKKELEDDSDVALGRLLGQMHVLALHASLTAFKAAPKAGRAVAAREFRKRAIKSRRKGKTADTEHFLSMARRVKRMT